jgi:hypothetical protein
MWTFDRSYNTVLAASKQRLAPPLIGAVFTAAAAAAAAFGAAGWPI